MPNQFSINPNQSRDQNALRGLTGSIQGYQQREQAAGLQAQKQGVIQQLQDAYANNDFDTINQISIANPELAKSAMARVGDKQTEAKVATRDALRKIALGGDHVAIGEALIPTLIKNGASSTETQRVMQLSPEEARKEAIGRLAMTDPEGFKAWQSSKPTFKQATAKGMGGWNFNEADGSYTLDPNYEAFLASDAGRLAAKDMLNPKDVSGINDKVSGLVKEAVQIRGAALDLEALASDASQPAVIAAIFKFMKALDPTSAVRENEVGMIEGAEGAAQGVANMYNRLMGEGGMSTEGFAEIVRTAKTLSNSAALSSSDSVNSYTEVMADNLLPKQLQNMRKRVPVQFEIVERAKSIPPQNAQGWGLQIDANGNKAYVGPNGEIDEVE
jgi:hypothetical protein